MMNCDKENICDIKIALTHNGRIRTFLRDDVAGFSFPAHWDLPGSPCLVSDSIPDVASQHMKTFMNLNIRPKQVREVRLLKAGGQGQRSVYLCFVELTPLQLDKLQSKQVGTRWRDMPVEDFFNHPRTLPILKSGMSALTDPSGSNGKVAA